MRPEEHDQQGWWEKSVRVSRAAVPDVMAVAGLALGVGAIVAHEPIIGACGAAVGVSVGLIQRRRARLHRDHVEALRKRLRTQRKDAEKVAAQLRQSVSSLQTDLWQYRMVALATPAFGIALAAATAQDSTAPAPPSTGDERPEQVAQAS
jgi:hypothetical protein